MDEYVDFVTRAKAGDPDAFSELVTRFQKMAYLQAYAVLNDMQLADDATQEAFLNAYLRLDQLREPAAFPGWLRRIVHKQCDRMVRGKQPILEPIENRFDLASDAPDPEATFEHQAMRERIHAAIQALPEHERDVTEGFYLQGETQKELAERLEIPLTTVKKRLQYARQHLRGLIGELNAAFDFAVSEMLPAKPKKARQPVYIYTRRAQDENDES